MKKNSLSSFVRNYSQLVLSILSLNRFKVFSSKKENFLVLIKRVLFYLHSHIPHFFLVILCEAAYPEIISVNLPSKWFLSTIF